MGRLATHKPVESNIIRRADSYGPMKILGAATKLISQNSAFTRNLTQPSTGSMAEPEENQKYLTRRPKLIGRRQRRFS